MVTLLGEQLCSTNNTALIKVSENELLDFKKRMALFYKKNYSFSILINSTSNTSSEPGPIEGLGELSP